MTEFDCNKIDWTPSMPTPDTQPLTPPDPVQEEAGIDLETDEQTRMKKKKGKSSLKIDLAQDTNTGLRI